MVLHAARCGDYAFELMLRLHNWRLCLPKMQYLDGQIFQRVRVSPTTSMVVTVLATDSSSPTCTDTASPGSIIHCIKSWKLCSYLLPPQLWPVTEYKPMTKKGPTDSGMPTAPISQLASQGQGPCAGTSSMHNIFLFHWQYRADIDKKWSILIQRWKYCALSSTESKQKGQFFATWLNYAVICCALKNLFELRRFIL